MLPSIEFHYLYRDASNYKRAGVVLFANPNALPVPEVEARLRAVLDDGAFFIADQVGIPEVFLWSPDADYDRDNPPPNLRAGQYCISDDDHCWHEFSEVVACGVPAPDSRTIEAFLSEMEAAQRIGWRQFDPKTHRPSANTTAPGRESERHARKPHELCIHRDEASLG